MVKLTEFYMTNGDRKTFERRAEYLKKRIESREAAGEPNAPGASHDRRERNALCRLLSQVIERGIEAMQTSAPTGTRFRGWDIHYKGGSSDTPWVAMKPGVDVRLSGLTMAEVIDKINIAIANEFGGGCV